MNINLNHRSAQFNQENKLSQQSSKPYVIINVAMTADGKIDTFERQGSQISSEDDWKRVDRLRAESDAVMV